MPMTMERATTPKGHPALKTLSTGVVALEEAQAFVRATSPGGPYENLPLMAVVGPELSMSGETRKAFLSGQGGLPCVALAMPHSNAVTRGLINFMIKAAPAAASGMRAPTKVFSSEAEAWAYLDQVLETPAR